MKKIIALFIILSLCFTLFACSTTPSDSDGKDKVNSGDGKEDELQKEEVTEAVAFITVDINPSIEITADADGTVASIYGANEDGQILLYTEGEKLIGVNYETAIDYITNLAVELGYLDAETGDINTSVIADDAELAKELRNKIGAKIKAAATENGITVKIDTRDAFSLLCELEALKEQYPDNVNIQAATASQYKLALTLSEREDISIVAAFEYDTDEVIKRINSAHGKLEAYATDAYLAAKSEAVHIFNIAMGIIIDGAYNEVYMANLMGHINTFYYGAVYQAYKTTARTYRSIYDIKVFADSMASFEVDEATVSEVAAELGLEDTECLKNEEGKITVESLIAFVDDFLKNNEVSEEIKSNVSEMIADAKVACELANKGTSELYQNDINSLKQRISTIVNTIKSNSTAITILMSEEGKAEFEKCLADLSEVDVKIGEIIEGGVTVSEIDVLATEAELKADEMLTKIKADLSESELKLAEAKIEVLKAAQQTLTQQFESRLTLAENEAKSYIEAKREERKNANNVN